MPRSRVSSVARRAVLLHLSLAAPGLVGCSGRLADGTQVDAGVSKGAASDGSRGVPDGTDSLLDAIVGAAPCAVIPGRPPRYFTGSCNGADYAFEGTSAECGGDGGLSLPLVTCQTLCPPLGADSGPIGDWPLSACTLETTVDGSSDLECITGCGKGRRPAGLKPCTSDSSRTPVADFLARIAYLEAASVEAFERLAGELAAHGAPVRLQRAARRAARDEARHTRVATALAERAGATVPRPRVRRGRVRSLAAIARENVVEGCVRETFGAAIALAQATTAGDPRVRAAMRPLAEDEMRHAELAWRVQRWIERRLDPRARARVSRERTRAVVALVREASVSPHAELVRELGLPTARQSRGLALDLARSLWAREK